MQRNQIDINKIYKNISEETFGRVSSWPTTNSLAGTGGIRLFGITEHQIYAKYSLAKQLGRKLRT